MRRNGSILATLLALLPMLSIVGSLGSGCSGKPIDESDPASLMSAAEDDIQNDHYQLAIDRLRTLKNRFPYSKLAVEAQLKIADVYYLQESYAEAAISYETFRDLHPRHEKTAYAMFRAAKSYFLDMPSTVARDLHSALKAQESYNAFIRRFPNAPETGEARDDLAKTRRTLAEKELEIAAFYLKRDFPDSARGRLEKVVALYPETDLAKEAKDKLAALPPPAERKTGTEGSR